MRSRPAAAEPSLTNTEIVTYAVALLGGIDRPVHLENVAMKSYELAPGAFRWDLDEYASYIDKDKVRVSLTDAAKIGKGALVRAVGQTKGGRTKKTDLWRLTAAGTAWVTEHGPAIEAATGAGMPALKRGKAHDLRRRISDSDLFRCFHEDGEVDYSPYDLADLLECSPDASNTVFRNRFEALRGQVMLLGDTHLEKFLDACASAHKKILEV
jgi:hypothetical protein